jgi:cbb3-type cytochrome oxidase cytochrome c subunit
MKRIVKIIGIVLVAFFILIQFIPRDHNENAAKPMNDVTQIYTVPANVGAMLKKSCYDCHSDHTDYPWYAQLQPFRFMLDRHIMVGKAELNFNEFATYSSRKQRSKLRAIGESLDEGSMPLSSYTFIHRDAVLSKEDQTLLKNWVKQTNDSLSIKN